MTSKVITPLIFVLNLTAPVAASYVYVWDGFEREINWSSVGSGAATGRTTDDQFASEGSRSLKLFFRSTSETGRALYSQRRYLDWASYGALIFDVYNPTDIEGLRVGIILNTTSRGLSHEALAPALEKGWNRDIRIDFHEPIFSSEASDYKPTGTLVGRGEITSLSLLVLPGTPSEGAVYLDNIRLEKKGILNLGSMTLNNSSDVTASFGTLDYIPPGIRLRQSDLLPLESFEQGATWAPIPANSAVTIEASADFTSHGATSLKVDFPAAPFGLYLNWTGMETRLKGVRQLRLETYNAGRSVTVSLLLYDNLGNAFETSSSVSPGWNTLIFDFTNQNAWDGAVIDAAVLDNLSSVSLRIYSRYAGRLYFDGLSAGDLSLNGAARVGSTFKLSAFPTSNLEMIVDWRIEDVYYGQNFSKARNAGPEGYFEAASIRWDAGDFRTGLLYGRKVTPFDNPIRRLVDENKLGEDILALEVSGRIRGLEIQGLASSRVEYEKYNRESPTRLGPENLLGLRLKRRWAKWIRTGATFLSHGSDYGAGSGGLIPGLPQRRETYALDLDSFMGGENVSLSWALEGGWTTGDSFPFGGNAPEDDPYYAAIQISPEWGRLFLQYTYRLMGFDFDADFTRYGGNTSIHTFNGSLDLDGLPVFRLLNTLPLYDSSLGNNLALAMDGFRYQTRDWYIDLVTGEKKPLWQSSGIDVALYNDARSKPNFSLGLSRNHSVGQWQDRTVLQRSLYFRLPLWGNVFSNFSWALATSRTKTLSSGQSGKDLVVGLGSSLEKNFKTNLQLKVNIFWNRSKNGWEGVLVSTEEHFKWNAEARQVLGADTVIRLIYGRPALLGRDFGLQDTLDVYTLELQSYF